MKRPDNAPETARSPAEQGRKYFSLTFITLTIALILGFWLRTHYLEDIEWKGDERTFFEWSRELGREKPWPWVGILSGAAVPNPAFMIWVMSLAGQWFGNQDPVAYIGSLQILCFVALLALAVFAWRQRNSRTGLEWWGTAMLGMVAPFTVVFQRKIWPQCQQSFFSLGCYLSWWQRESKTGAFFWGLFGALLGQIHMSGFFPAAALFLWTALFDRPSKTKWSWWLGGSILGGLPLLPWLHFLATSPDAEPIHYGWGEAWKGRYFKAFITESTGIKLDYFLGTSFKEYLAYPLWGQSPTFVVALVHFLLLGITAFVVFRAFLQLLRTSRLQGWRSALKSWFVPDAKWDPTGFLISALFWGSGILLTLATPKVWLHRHYVTVVFPIAQLWLVRLIVRYLPKPRVWILWVFAFQFLLSYQFLQWIHVHCGAPGQEYGVAYRCQDPSSSQKPSHQ